MESGRIERTFTLPPGAVPTIVARVPSGTLQILGQERGDTAVTVTVQPADALGRDLEIVLEEQGGRIHAEVRAPGRGDSPIGWLRGALSNPRVMMEIRTPLRSNVEAGTASADVDLAHLDGEIRVRTASGDIRAERLARAVAIQSASGDIRAHALSGHVRIQSASGDVKVERCEGDVVVQTASGDVELDQISGTLDAATASGDCLVGASALGSCRARTASGDLNVTTPLSQEGDYEFTTVSGDLLLLVPQETRMTVSMKTVSGDLSCALPAATTQGGKRNRTMTVNGGGVPVQVKTVSGDCAIRAASGNLPSLRHDAPLRAAAPPVPPMPPVPHAPIMAPQESGGDDLGETLAVLQAVERGELTIDEAMARLAALEGGQPDEPARE